MHKIISWYFNSLFKHCIDSFISLILLGGMLKKFKLDAKKCDLAIEDLEDKIKFIEKKSDRFRWMKNITIDNVRYCIEDIEEYKNC